MKLVYLVPDLGITVDGHKGASSHIRGFVGALKALGHEVVILTTNSVAPGTIDVPIEVIEPPLFIKQLDITSSKRVGRALRHVWMNSAIEEKLASVIGRYNPDFVYERYSPFSVAGSLVSKSLGLPHILEVNAPLAEQGKLYRKQALQEASEFLEMTAFQETGLLVTLTDELRDWLVGLGFPKEKVKVRPSGVDPDEFSPIGPSFRKDYKGKIVIGFVGSLKGWHDIEIMCQAFDLLVADPRYHLLVVGDGPMRDVVKSTAEMYPDRVTMTGAVPQEEVPKYLRTVDIALAPYPDLDLFYFSPLKVYEYMSAGCPVVASGIGQLNHLITNGVNGFTVPPGDVGALVSKIRELADNKDLRTAVGAKAAEEAHKYHTWEKRAGYFVSFAEKFLENRISVV